MLYGIATGGIPPELGQLDKLKKINLSNNQLTGEVDYPGNIVTQGVVYLSNEAFNRGIIATSHTGHRKDAISRRDAEMPCESIAKTSIRRGQEFFSPEDSIRCVSMRQKAVIWL